MSSCDPRRILVSGRLALARRFLERSRNHQTDCRDDREQRYASRCRKTSGPHPEQKARVANFRLVQQRIAFNDHEYGNRCPEAEANKPGADVTRWGGRTHGLLTQADLTLLEAEHTRTALYTPTADILLNSAACCIAATKGWLVYSLTAICKRAHQAAWPQSITFATHRSSC